nr:VOC family protein [Vallicoccus soli]
MGTPGPVTADDVQRTTEAAVAALSAAPDGWDAPAQGVEWSCWESLDHLAETLVAYALQVTGRPQGRYVPFAAAAARPGGPELALRVDPGSGADGMLEALRAAGVLLAAAVRSEPGAVAWHPSGTSDAESFAAMGVVELVAHVRDVAAALGVAWEPPRGACDRALARILPEARERAGGADPCAALLWATGRAGLPGLAPLEAWRWRGRTGRTPGHAPPAGLSLVTVLVEEYGPALAFYRDALGFEVVEDTDRGDGKRWVVVAPRAGHGAAVLLARADSERQRARVGDQHGGRVGLFLTTRDFAADHARMAAAGVRFLEQPRREAYGTVAVFEDLHGNRWDLLEPAG